ncbi:adenosylmethionine decarboxylase [Trinickia sp.]|uniref:adenosylmethionine decarboxylase n=1 Tax=Trinickia sp. TaxID=2571163 RepID=UPI003F7E9EA8
MDPTTVRQHSARKHFHQRKPLDIGSFAGMHLMAELYGVDGTILDDSQFLTSSLANAVAQSGATLCGMQTKQFTPSGVTIVALLSESHASIHTYPEKRAMFLDIFTCGECRPHLTLASLIESLKPTDWNSTEIRRGNE